MQAFAGVTVSLYDSFGPDTVGMSAEGFSTSH